MSTILDPIPKLPQILGEARQDAYIVENLDDLVLILRCDDKPRQLHQARDSRCMRTRSAIPDEDC